MMIQIWGRLTLRRRRVLSLSLSSSIDLFSLSTHNEAYLEKPKNYNLTLTLVQEVVGVVFELAMPSAVEKVLLRRMLGIQ